MVIYLDLIFLINFAFDILLLLVVAIALKRKVSLWKIILGGFIGGLSIFFLFIPVNTFSLFLYKIIISLIMILSCFGYKDIKYFSNNIIALYITSIILGGCLYLLSIQFSYKNEGLIFYYDKMSINFIVLLIISPIALYIYIKQLKSQRLKYNNYYAIELFLKNGQKMILNAFLDTGNRLKDPYFNLPIIIIDEKHLKGKISLNKPIYVPFNTINNHSLLKCYKGLKMVIKDLGETNKFLIGVSDKKINIEGIDCIINQYILEDLKC